MGNFLKKIISKLGSFLYGEPRSEREALVVMPEMRVPVRVCVP